MAVTVSVRGPGRTLLTRSFWDRSRRRLREPLALGARIFGVGLTAEALGAANTAPRRRTVGPIETVTTCFHHPDRETGRSCTRCGRPACSECLHDAPVGAHCFECIRAARPPARQRFRRWNATAGPVATKTLIAINVVVFLLTAT